MPFCISYKEIGPHSLGVFVHGSVYFPIFYKKLNSCWAIIIFCKKNCQTYLHRFRVNGVAEKYSLQSIPNFFFSVRPGRENPQKYNLAFYTKDEARIIGETHADFQSDNYNIYIVIPEKEVAPNKSFQTKSSRINV